MTLVHAPNHIIVFKNHLTILLIGLCVCEYCCAYQFIFALNIACALHLRIYETHTKPLILYEAIVIPGVWNFRKVPKC